GRRLLPLRDVRQGPQSPTRDLSPRHAARVSGSGSRGGASTDRGGRRSAAPSGGSGSRGGASTDQGGWRSAAPSGGSGSRGGGRTGQGGGHPGQRGAGG